jgi:peptide alpha-N-acetyltransferase
MTSLIEQLPLANENGKTEVDFAPYKDETEMSDIMSLVQIDFSEPYNIYTYRYFIHNWPQLCFLAREKGRDEIVGAIVCKLDQHKKLIRRGYIAMLAVHKRMRKCGIGKELVRRAIEAMDCQGCDEVVLETEITNLPALRLYERLGFVRDERLFQYYLNGVDAFRLKLWLR